MTRTKRVSDAPQECVRCGTPLTPKARRGGTLCRVCATRSSYTFLEQALANRRKRSAAA